MVITIGRECGCDGDEIGILLGQKLNIPCYNRESLLELARQKGIYEKYPHYFSEIPEDAVNKSMREDESSDALMYEPQNAMKSILENENCVVVGRCGNYALKDREDKISIFLTGDKYLRIANIAKKHNVNEKKAREILEKTDNRRREYQKYYTGEIWGNARNYDICVNEARIGIEGTIAVIEQYIKNTGVK